MKKFLFLSLLLIISSQTLTDSQDTIKFFKCLLLDSDVVFNHLSPLVEALLKMDPAKLITEFTTIYQDISAEVERCKTPTSEKPVVKPEQKKTAPTQNIYGNIMKLFIQYVLPILKTLGIDLTQICKMIFPDLPFCDVLQFL